MTPLPSMCYVGYMDITERNLFRTKVRFRCSACGTYTLWWSQKGLARIGETEYSYQRFWSDLHARYHYYFMKEDA